MQEIIQQGDAQLSQIVEQIQSLLDKLKRLPLLRKPPSDPPDEIPPHTPDPLQRLIDRAGLGFAGLARLGRDAGDSPPGADAAERRAEQARAEAEARERERRRQENEEHRAAMAGDIYAIRAELGDEQFMEVFRRCLETTAVAGVFGGPEAAIPVLLADDNCRKAFVESAKRTYNQISARLQADRQREIRERFERMDRNQYEMERYSEFARTA
jgi:hypothetical protein